MKPVTLPDVRRRCTTRLQSLDFLRVSERAFGLGEIPSGLANGSFFVTVPDGISLPTWRANAANGVDFQSNVQVKVAYKLGPHRSVKDHDVALMWGNRILIHLIVQDETWPIDLRMSGHGNTVNVQPDSGGNFLLIDVGAIARHALSLTEAA